MDFSSADFLDLTAVDTELRRVYDVCHSCRMCFNYCPSFPALFDAIDAHEEKGEGEVQALTSAEKQKVVDLCYQCKLCYVKCPYTPPHTFAIDFPRLMLRAKAARAHKEGVTAQDKFLGDPDFLGKRSSGIMARATNLANRTPALRIVMEKTVGIHRDRHLPPFAHTTFATWFHKRRKLSGAPRKVAIFETCSVNYNYPFIGEAAVQIFEHNGFEVLRPEQRCCGMPALDGGDLNKAKELAAFNLEMFSEIISNDIPLVALGPTCGYTIKQEWPLLLGPERAQKLAGRVMDVGEFLSKQKLAQKLDLDFKKPQGKIAYHLACHLRAQNIGAPFKTLLEAIPGTTLSIVEKCSAFDGTWGMKTEYYTLSKKYAGKLVRELENSQAEVLVSDCPLAGINVIEALGRRPVHPLEVVRDAYGLSGTLPVVA